MLPVIRAAAFWMESRARCAYRAVVCTCVRPSSFPIIVRLSLRASALDAYECLRPGRDRNGIQWSAEDPIGGH